MHSRNRTEAFRRRCRGTLAVMLTALLLVGCASWTGDVQQEPPEDAVKATRIKAALLSEPELGAAAITVKSDPGRVTLTGFVADRALRRRAGAIATDHADGARVVNRIEVKSD